MKAHVHHSWQNYSSCTVNQAQASLFAKPICKAHQGQASPHTNLNKWRTCELVSQIPAIIETARAPSHQATTCLIRSENGHVSIKG